MIKSIVETFKTQARQHKTIKAFSYGRIYEKGSGKDRHPLKPVSTKPLRLSATDESTKKEAAKIAIPSSGSKTP